MKGASGKPSSRTRGAQAEGKHPRRLCFWLYGLAEWASLRTALASPAVQPCLTAGFVPSAPAPRSRHSGQPRALTGVPCNPCARGRLRAGQGVHSGTRRSEVTQQRALVGQRAGAGAGRGAGGGGAGEERRGERGAGSGVGGEQGGAQGGPSLPPSLPPSGAPPEGSGVRPYTRAPGGRASALQ